MYKYLILALLVVSLSAMQLNARGKGITQAQQIQIVQLASYAYLQMLGNCYMAAKVLQYNLEYTFGQYWVIEYLQAINCVTGRAGIPTKNDQWVSYYLEDYELYFWVWVPAPTTNYVGLQVEPSNTVFNRALLNTVFSGALSTTLKSNIQQHGTGISDGQTITIEKIMKNAELVKGKDPQANADFIQEKLVDAYGQNWIVEIIGSDYRIWGRYEMKFSNDQWLFYTEFGSSSWQYFIWVPSY